MTFSQYLNFNDHSIKKDIVVTELKKKVIILVILIKLYQFVLTQTTGGPRIVQILVSQGIVRLRNRSKLGLVLST